MSCNYYLKPKGFDEINELNDNIEVELSKLTVKYIDDVNNITEKACNISPLYKELLDLPDLSDLFIQMQWPVELPEIHVCKMSLGWVPCFQSNKMYKTYKEFLEFYTKHKDIFTLINEYDEEIDLEKFKEDLKYFKDKALPNNNRANNYNMYYISDEDGFDWIDNDFS